MAMKSADPTHRSIHPASVPGLSGKVREAVNDTFEAMRTWRSEVRENNEKNVKQVIDKMAAAAATLGWPSKLLKSPVPSCRA
jgi:hypothetical protein